MKLAIYITTAVIVLAATSCGVPVNFEAGYSSPNTGIDYTVQRNSGGGYTIKAYK
jgi:hypothetical protein